eukprot:CAMPEP_0169431770 /NCGR_PEP_ID=MMETSP1042-20121227/3124_1 /TAXON_ID=464988 /ORGANISM="Hemiselmis andersenii, Strain CCMP1180" /LENGTH=379 /DNA_ID=CAMNT_0009542203 /DNA_START=59 /DNA_END=1200 /DNA_ORIENTATION=+
MVVLGDAFMSAMLLVLGGNMQLPSTSPGQKQKPPTAHPPESATAGKLEQRVVGLTVVARLVALPLIGLALQGVVEMLGLLPDDKLLRFVLLLQFTAPTAANLGTVATYQGHGQREVSQVALQQYLFAVPAITAFMVYYLTLFDLPPLTPSCGPSGARCLPAAQPPRKNPMAAGGGHGVGGVQETGVILLYFGPIKSITIKAFSLSHPPSGGRLCWGQCPGCVSVVGGSAKIAISIQSASPRRCHMSHRSSPLDKDVPLLQSLKPLPQCREPLLKLLPTLQPSVLPDKVADVVREPLVGLVAKANLDGSVRRVQHPVLKARRQLHCPLLHPPSSCSASFRISFSSSALCCPSVTISTILAPLVTAPAPLSVSPSSRCLPL